jgi:hypothetical protein
VLGGSGGEGAFALERLPLGGETPGPDILRRSPVNPGWSLSGDAGLTTGARLNTPATLAPGELDDAGEAGAGGESSLSEAEVAPPPVALAALPAAPTGRKELCRLDALAMLRRGGSWGGREADESSPPSLPGPVLEACWAGWCLR